MSADILAQFYGIIFFSAIFIIAAARVVISCALDQLARQEYLASNGYSVEYDFYAPTGVVPGVQYAQPPV